MNETQALVLASGGVDSTACIEFYMRQGLAVKALFIDYGQPAIEQERSAVAAVSKHYNIALSAIRCTGFGQLQPGALTGRNAFFFNAALMFWRAQSGIIAMGIHAGTSYADCSPGFAESMQDLAQLYT